MKNEFPEIEIRVIDEIPELLQKAYDNVITNHPKLKVVPISYYNGKNEMYLTLLAEDNYIHRLTVYHGKDTPSYLKNCHFHCIFDSRGHRLDMIKVAIILDTTR